jgi:hypothetical protein
MFNVWFEAKAYVGFMAKCIVMCMVMLGIMPRVGCGFMIRTWYLSRYWVSFKVVFGVGFI